MLLIEAALVMLFFAVLSMSLAPAVGVAFDEARALRARHDLKTITVALTRYVGDVWAQSDRVLNRYALLAGPGNVPGAAAAGTAGWRLSDHRVGLLNAHLVTNPGYLTPTPPAFGGWRGPYLEGSIETDPWGNRYAVNTTALFTPELDTVAVSAGADGLIETPFLANSVTARGDDVLIIVFSTGRTVNR